MLEPSRDGDVSGQDGLETKSGGYYQFTSA